MPPMRAGRADGLRRAVGRAQGFQLVWTDASGSFRFAQFPHRGAGEATAGCPVGARDASATNWFDRVDIYAAGNIGKETVRYVGKV